LQHEDKGQTPYTTAAAGSSIQTWQWPACRRTSQVPHRVRRLTSYAQEPQKSARKLYGSTHVTFSSLCFLTWQASLSSLICQMRMPLNAVRMHADLQGMSVAWAVALTLCHSSKDLSLIAGPTPVCLLTSCRNSGMQSSTCTLAAFSSGLPAIARSGGRVTSVQTTFHTSGMLLLRTGRMGGAVLSAQA